MLLDADIQDFIAAHTKSDVAQLALKKAPNPTWDYKLVLEQIRARQKADKKIPHWLSVNSIIMPPPDLIEQASSQATATYKASLSDGKTFVDLTAGCGVDSLAIANSFENGVCIEKNEYASQLLRHNLPLLTSKPIEVLQQDTHDFVQEMKPVDLIIIDPQRRDNKGKGKFRFEDCDPDILKLLPQILNKTRKLLIKASPMLDIDQAIKTLECVEEIYCVEWKGDCKELLLMCSQTPPDEPVIHAVSIDDSGTALKTISFTQKDEKAAQADFSWPCAYIYEPGPAFQKAAPYTLMSEKFDVKKLHPHTHMYTSEHLISGFPGRVFDLQAVLAVKKGAVNLKAANIATRNFPLSPENLRKKLKIKEGGEDYIYGCTLADNSKKLLHLKRLQ